MEKINYDNIKNSALQELIYYVRTTDYSNINELDKLVYRIECLQSYIDMVTKDIQEFKNV